MIRPVTLAFMFSSFLPATLLAQSPSVTAAPEAASVHPEYGVPVLQVLEADLDGDEIQDTVLLVDEGCEAGKCPWVILFGGSAAQMTGGYASDISVTTWKGPGQDASLRGVRADDVTWGMMSGHLFPVNDLISSGTARIGFASDREATIIASQTPFGAQDPANYRMWRANILPDGGDEVIITVPVAGSALVGAPWFILAGDAVAAYGWSLDWPRIYPDSAGATVISIARNGMSTVRME